MKLTYEIIKTEDLIQDRFNLLVDMGFKSAEPDQPQEREFFETWLAHIIARPGTIFAIYYTEENIPVACYCIVDVSYGGAFNSEEWQGYMEENNLPNGRGLWGCMEYRFVLPEYKGKGIATAQMRDRHDMLKNNSTYQYIFMPRAGYGSKAAETFAENYYKAHYDYKMIQFEEFSVNYFKL